MATTLETKRAIIAILSIFFLSVLIIALWKETKRQMPGYRPSPIVDKGTEHCIKCHGAKGAGVVITEQWKISKHAEVGVGCLECHGAAETDIDAYKHEGYFIATIVTPNDCGKCHTKEVKEFTGSHHADAGMIMGSLDNVLAEVVEGSASFKDGSNPAAASGCWQCHGSRVGLQLDSNGKSKFSDSGILQLDPKTWPNTGIGRINLDGSKGSCSACHNRHHFSVEQVRQPENCGKCHMGPDHPQIEIYEESKHGVNFNAHREKMNLAAQPWIVGVDYFAAPTCATCHMSATPDQPVTHEVGNRISWTLRPQVSEKIDAALLSKFKKTGQEVPENFLTWEARRQNMQNVCLQCHTKKYVESFYLQYDNVVELFNEKFGKPSLLIMNKLKSSGMLTPIDFDDKLEWTYYFLWHHEGRRARMGASMMGPDYTQWHGNFEVADRFYTQFVPEVKELIEHWKRNGKSREAGEVEMILNEILNSEMHQWSIGKMDPEEVARRKEASEEFRKRYTVE